MAEAFYVNEGAPYTTGLYVVWRLVRTLVAAGWTVTQSSNGTTYGAADYWTTYEGLGTSAWIVLRRGSNQQLCFWRNTTSTDSGKIIYDYLGSFTFASSSASTPGTLPTTAQYVRGSSGTFNTWFGSSSATFPVSLVHVAAKDVSDGSFWVIGISRQAAGAFSTAYHTLGFFSLYTASTGTDVDPYVFYSPVSSATGDTISGSPSGPWNDTVLADQEVFWYGLSRNFTWTQFRPWGNTAIQAGGGRDPYSAGYPYVGELIAIGKAVANLNELKGFVKHARSFYWNVRGTVFHDQNGPFRWVGVGSNAASAGCAFFWDGKTPIMGYEY